MIGARRSAAVEGHGLPLGAVITGVNAPDARLLDATIQAIALEHRPVEPDWLMWLRLEKGYNCITGYAVCVDSVDVSRIDLIRNEDPHSEPSPSPSCAVGFSSGYSSDSLAAARFWWIVTAGTTAVSASSGLLRLFSGTATTIDSQFAMVSNACVSAADVYVMRYTGFRLSPRKQSIGDRSLAR